MTLSRTTRVVLLAALLLGLAVVYIPLLVVVVNSFNVDATFAWPPDELTTEWWRKAVDNTGARDAI
ncbi:MAG: ABC transporter permease, partial [Nocardioidaceae bacterium]